MLIVGRRNGEPVLVKHKATGDMLCVAPVLVRPNRIALAFYERAENKEDCTYQIMRSEICDDSDMPLIVEAVGSLVRGGTIDASCASMSPHMRRLIKDA